ncbi:MAG: gluconate kinase [Myxococcaceae bacterium]|nr:gluconate kinase [Myxococcaceae bacterium]
MDDRERSFAVPATIVVMGVSGVGKSTVGERLARRLSLPYADADAFHSAESRAKMAAGQALSDADRAPWLRELGAFLAAHADSGAVATCSALKRAYRDVLVQAAPGLVFLHLTSDAAQLSARIAARRGHFMPLSLLESQLATLEPLQPDERGESLEVAQLTPEQLVERCLTLLSREART